MSSLKRSFPEGQIRQDKKIIGSICLPEEDAEEFIDQFNNCYGPLRMHIQSPAPNVVDRKKSVAPVGATRDSNSKVAQATFVFDTLTSRNRNLDDNALR